MRALSFVVAVSVVSACTCLKPPAPREKCLEDGGCSMAGHVCATDLKECVPTGGTGGGTGSCSCAATEVCGASDKCFPRACGAEPCGDGFACDQDRCVSVAC